VQRNKLLPQDLSSIINSDLGSFSLPTNQLATEFLSLHVSDPIYLINPRHGFFRFVFSRLYWNKLVFLFVTCHISSPLDKMHFAQMAITSGDIALCRYPDGPDGIRIKLRRAKLNDDLSGKTLTPLEGPQ